MEIIEDMDMEVVSLRLLIINYFRKQEILHVRYGQIKWR